jgi:hypothetical protein
MALLKNLITFQDVEDTSFFGSITINPNLNNAYVNLCLDWRKNYAKV